MSKSAKNTEFSNAANAAKTTKELAKSTTNATNPSAVAPSLETATTAGGGGAICLRITKPTKMKPTKIAKHARITKSA